MRNKFLADPDLCFHPLRKILIMFSGLRYAVVHEISFIYELVISVIVLVFGLYFLDWVDIIILVVSTGQVLASEMFNTAIEAICDVLESNENQKIGIIKDLSAAAVGISVAVWAIAIAYECFRIAIWFKQ